MKFQIQEGKPEDLVKKKYRIQFLNWKQNAHGYLEHSNPALIVAKQEKVHYANLFCKAGFLWGSRTPYHCRHNQEAQYDILL